MTEFTSGNTSSEAMAGRNEAELLAKLAELQAENDRLRGTGDVETGQFRGEVPRYHLNAPCFLEDDTYHHEGEVIDYIGVPNLEMAPLNDAAKARIQERIDVETDAARISAERAGREFHGLFTDRGTAIAQSMQDARRSPAQVQMVSMPTVKDGPAPQMPHTPDAQVAQRRGRGRPPKNSLVVAVQAAPLGPAKPAAEPMSVIGRRSA